MELIKRGAMAAMCAVLFSSPNHGQAQEADFSNEAIWASGTFRTEYVWGIRSMADGKHYTTLEYDEEQGSCIVKWSYKTGRVVDTLLTSVGAFGDARETFGGYVFSSDERFVVLTTASEGLYRHSFYANFYVYDFEAEEDARPVTDFRKGKQRLAQLSPAGDKVAFVRENNIFISDLASGAEVQVTDDGVTNAIINGATDWVYEEEFGDDQALFWNHDGTRLAYLKFDESNVREFHMPVYGSLYPDPYTFKYPKAGEDNSEVGVYIYTLADDKSREVAVPKSAYYIPRIKWTKDAATLCIFTMNRHQNDLRLLLTDGEFPNDRLGTREVFKETCNTYIDINDNLTFLADGSSFVMTSERDEHNHIYKFDFDGNVTQLTRGDWDVVDVLGFDAKRKRVHFTSSQAGATQKHTSFVDLRGRVTILDSAPGTHSDDFSNSFDYSIHQHSTANTPPVFTLRDRKGKVIRTLKDNAQLRQTMAEYGAVEKEFFTFTNDAGVELNCWKMLPQDFDPAKKYPVYVAIYGGPGANTVNDSWGGATFMWQQYLAQEGYIVVSCDPRGTQFRGRKFEHSTYKELGKLETEDFIDLAEHLGNWEYVDAERIGIQGWSYGGFMTLLCMTKGADVYNAGISVAPVTNWRYYDTIYTERFMRTPQENESGYDDNSPVNHADKLEGALLLVHGSGDDNVHYQNSMEMINALVAANKDFDFFVYPDRNHGIYGGNTRLHLFNMMMDFVKENF
ncbi:MAG: S9 family peptidase [Bacteroidota bacterium]|nr:S9 family peptidase [Bacteroidota bacterium]